MPENKLPENVDLTDITYRDFKYRLLVWYTGGKLPNEAFVKIWPHLSNDEKRKTLLNWVDLEDEKFWLQVYIPNNRIQLATEIIQLVPQALAKLTNLTTGYPDLTEFIQQAAHAPQD